MHDESVGREGGAGAEQGKKKRDGNAHRIGSKRGLTYI
jgi:hypothetical protein